MYGAVAAAMFVAAAISVAVAFSAWDRRPLPGATGLSAYMLVTGLWALSYGMGLVSGDHALESFWYIFMYTALIATPPTVFALAHQYKYQTDEPPRWSWLLWIVPAIIWLSMVTDPAHLLFTGGIGWVFHSGVETGPFWWANVVYSYALIVAAIGMLITAGERWGRRYRAQSMALVVSFLTPFAVSIVSVAWSLPRYNVDFTPLATAIAGLILAVAMFRYGLFRTAPIAREKLVDLTSDGMVVVDRDGGIVDYNLAATNLLNITPKCLGCSITEHLPEWPDTDAGAPNDSLEFVARSSDGKRSLKVNVTPIHRQSVTAPGARLAVIRDISAEVAVIAIEQQARRRAELEAAFTSTVGQSLDYTQIITGMLNTAREVAGADYALFLSYDPDGTDCELEASAGLDVSPGGHSSHEMCGLIRTLPIFTRLVETGEPILVNDAQAEPDLASPGHMMVHLRSVLAVRMDAWGIRKGALVLGDTLPGAFASTDASRIMTLANVAAAALRNAEQLHTIETQAATTEAERAKLRSILDALLDPLVALEPIRSDNGDIKDFIVTDLNPLAAAFQGMDRSALLGRAISTLRPGTIHGLVELLAEAIASGETFFRSGMQWAASGETDRFIDVQAVPYANGIIINWRDVTERKSAEREIRESEQRFRLLAENSLSAVIRISESGEVTWASPSLYDALGWPPAGWIGQPLASFVHPDDDASVLNVDTIADTTKSRVSRIRMVDPGGLYHWMEILTRAYTNANGQPEGTIASLRTVDEEVAIEQELERRARYDELTGVLNRRAVMERVAETAARGARTGQHLAIMFCDLDKLKDTNEQYGHLGGDRLIRTVAQRMVATLRETDTVGRFGGDEFLILLEGIHDLEGAASVAEKVRTAVAKPIDMGDGTSMDPGVSIDVTMMTDGEDIDDVIERANRGLFGAKHAGRAQVKAVPVEGDE